MQITEEELNSLAMYALVTGLTPDREEKINACGCRSCAAAAVMLRLVKDRMLVLIEAENATKN